MALGKPVAMSRPIYETEADRANEAAVMETLFERWRCQGLRMPKLCGVDYALYRNGRLMAWVEIKCRSNPQSQYDTYAVSEAKMLAGRALAEQTNLPFMLVVQWTDCLGWVQPERYEVRSGGRRDRADAQDIESMAHIPIAEFKLL